MKINEILEKNTNEGALGGAVLGGLAGSLVGHPIAGTLLGAALGKWLKKDKQEVAIEDPNHAVYINGKLYDGRLTATEAVQLIMDLAEKEHNRKTEYTIFDTEQKRIVFRQYWSDYEDYDKGINLGWQQVNTENKEVK